MGDRNCTNYSSTKSTPTTPTAALPGRAVFPSPSLPAGRDFGRGTMLQPLGWRNCHCFDLLAASIRKSGLEIENRCTVCPCFDLLAASIRKSRLEIKNRCTDCPCFDLLAAAIAKSGPEIENRCSTIVAAKKNGPPAVKSWGAGGDRMP